MAKNKVRRPVNIHSVYDDLRNVKGDKVRKYGIRDILNRSTIIKKSQVIHINHLYDDTPDIEKLVEYMEDIDYRGGIDYNEKKQDVIVGARLKGGKIIVRFLAQKPKSGGGVIPTRIQEKGSVAIFNRVLVDNKSFKTKEDFKADDVLWNELLDIFKGWEERLPLWIHTYHEQQRKFLEKYEGKQWDTFVYDGNDFVTFFRQNLPRITRDPNSDKPVGDYTTWNPSDIYAADNLKDIQKNIKAVSYTHLTLPTTPYV